MARITKKMMDAENARVAKAFREGIAAAKAGVGHGSNPYPVEDQRVCEAWAKGYEQEAWVQEEYRV